MPQAMEDTMNSAMAAQKIVRLPKRSAIQPEIGINGNFLFQP